MEYQDADGNIGGPPPLVASSLENSSKHCKSTCYVPVFHADHISHVEA